MFVRITAITPLGTFKTRPEEMGDSEIEELVQGIKMAASGKANYFLLNLPSGQSLTLGMGVLTQSILGLETFPNAPAD
jgi:hypothetical protein